MTHPDLGDDTELSRRARRHSKQQERVRRVTTITAAVVLALAFGLFATETVRFGGGDGPTFAGAVRAQIPGTTSSSTTTTLPVPKCRAPLTDTDPLRLWVGGDSLAGSLGPSLGTIAGATGVVQPYFDSRGVERAHQPDVLRLAQSRREGDGAPEPGDRRVHHRRQRLSGTDDPHHDHQHHRRPRRTDRRDATDGRSGPRAVEGRLRGTCRRDAHDAQRARPHGDLGGPSPVQERTRQRRHPTDQRPVAMR